MFHNEKADPRSQRGSASTEVINLVADIITFPARCKQEVLADYRSGLTVLSCDSPYDVAEPYASELEALMLAGRPLGFTYAWRHPDLSEGLRRELERIRLPMWEIGDVVIMARDFRVIGELPPDSAATSEPTRLAA